MNHESASSDRTCPVCGEDRVTTFFHRDTFEYGTGASAVTLHVDLPVRRCAECDLEFLDHEAEQLRHDAVCNHLGVLTSTQVRAIRKQYGMTRSSFAEVTGLGEATLNRWENGVVIQNPANDRYLRLLGMPDVFRRLAELPAGPSSQVHKPVSIVKLHRWKDPRETASQHTKRRLHASDPDRGWKSQPMGDLSRPQNLIQHVYKRKIRVTKTPARIGMVRKPVVEDQEYAGSSPYKKI